MTAVIYFIGACLTAVGIAILFSRRYPGNRRWLWAGIAIGVAAMMFWPITLWVALALWQTGFGRPQLGPPTAPRFPKKIILPASAVGSIATLIAIGATVPPAPALTSESTPSVTSTTSATPTLAVVPSVTTPAVTTSPTTRPPATPSPTPARVATRSLTPAP